MMFPIITNKDFFMNFKTEIDIFDKLLNQEKSPKLNSKKTEKGFELEIDIPGVKKEDIDIKIEKGILTIKGERKTEKKEEKDTYIMKEVSYGEFKRRFSLPENINEEEIEASFEDGVLKLIIPEKNKEIEEAKKILIK